MNEVVSIDYSEISPGVRDLVRELREVHGLETTDSGDGTNHALGMECAIPYRHVFIQTEDEHKMIEVTKMLSTMYPDYYVECSWSPSESAVVMVWPDGNH